MKSLNLRLPFVVTLVVANLATFLIADQQNDPADLPVPMTLVSARLDADSDMLDALDVGPTKISPYQMMEDDPSTPISPSTVSQFSTLANDVDPYDILERPGIRVGWFTELELTAANATMSNRMQSEAFLGPNAISVPSAPLDWTAMPKFTLGYRLPEGRGELSASYRFLISQGDGSLANNQGTDSSRLQFHVLDLDYGLSDLFPNDLWLVPRQIRITAGVRVAGIDYKTSAMGVGNPGQTASNTFYGAGPRLSFETLYPIASSRWTLFGKLDTAGVIGTDRQTFTQSSGGVTTTGVSNPSTTATPVLGLRAGVNWLPNWGGGNVKMSAGYQWERWYDLGIDTTSYNELTILGPFLRGEVAF